MSNHALLSASGSYRWINCTPSARLEEKFPNKSTPYAEEGTIAHEAAAAVAMHKILGAELLISDAFTDEMIGCAEAYARLIDDRLAAHQTAFAEFETRLDFSNWVKDGFGTGDCVIVTPDALEIIDYKYGKGVPVSAIGNTQMRLYALGALQRYGTACDVKKIVMTIFQPRLSGVPDSDEISIKELLDWAETVVKPRAALAYAGKGDFNPSEKTCRFCKAKQQCKARANFNLSLFNDNKEIISANDAGKILEKAGDIKAWLSDLEDLVFSTITNGQKVDGWKIVEGRSIRKISDELKAVEILKANGISEALLYEKKLLSLTQMERDFGKKAVAEMLGDLVVKPEGKPTLAPASDKRPEFQSHEKLLEAFDN